MIRSSARFKRFALALMLARVAAFAAAPLFERVPVLHEHVAVSEHGDRAPLAGVIAHDEATCPTCILLQGYTNPAPRNYDLATLIAGESLNTAALTAPPSGAPRAGFHSRAPPVQAA